MSVRRLDCFVLFLFVAFGDFLDIFGKFLHGFNVGCCLFFAQVGDHFEVLLVECDVLCDLLNAGSGHGMNGLDVVVVSRSHDRELCYFESLWYCSFVVADVGDDERSSLLGCREL